MKNLAVQINLRRKKFENNTFGIQPEQPRLRLIGCLSKKLYTTKQWVYSMNDREYMARICHMERRLYRIAHAILWNDSDCADAIQETVFRGWIGRASLREERYFDTWIIRILINECRSQLRRRKVRALPLEETRIPSAEDTLAEDLQLRMALKALPQKYRLPLLLHHEEGYRLDEIAGMLDISQSLVKSRLHQARKALRVLIENGDDTL